MVGKKPSEPIKDSPTLCESTLTQPQLFKEQFGAIMDAAAQIPEFFDEFRKILQTHRHKDVLNVKLGDDITPLIHAIKLKRTEIVKLLLEFEETEVNMVVRKIGKDVPPLAMACYIGCLEIVEALLRRKDIEVNSPTVNLPLTVAMECGHVDIVKLLLEDPRINVNINNSDGFTPLHLLAANKGNKEMTALLLSKTDIDVNIRCDATGAGGAAPLHWAAANAATTVLELLLAHPDIDFNDQNEYGRNPLSCAVYSKLISKDLKLEVVKAILKYKEVDVNIRAEPAKMTPLLEAAQDGFTEMVELLLQREDVDVNMPDGVYGYTPLYVACDDGNVEIVEMLLKFKGVVNLDVNKLTVRGITGGTAFSAACFKGHTAVVKLILQSKHDVNIDIASSGQTPLQQAIAGGHTEIVQLLRDHKKQEKVVSLVSEKKVGRSAEEKARRKEKRRQEKIEFRELEKSLDTLD